MEEIHPDNLHDRTMFGFLYDADDNQVFLLHKLDEHKYAPIVVYEPWVIDAFVGVINITLHKMEEPDFHQAMKDMVAIYKELRKAIRRGDELHRGNVNPNLIKAILSKEFPDVWEDDPFDGKKIEMEGFSEEDKEAIRHALDAFE